MEEDIDIIESNDEELRKKSINKRNKISKKRKAFFIFLMFCYFCGFYYLGAFGLGLVEIRLERYIESMAFDAIISSYVALWSGLIYFVVFYPIQIFVLTEEVLLNKRSSIVLTIIMFIVSCAFYLTCAMVYMIIYWKTGIIIMSVLLTIFLIIFGWWLAKFIKQCIKRKRLKT